MWLGERLPMTCPVWVDKGKCVFRSTYVCFDLEIESIKYQ